MAGGLELRQAQIPSAEAIAARENVNAVSPEMAADASTAGRTTLSFSEALGIETKSLNPLTWFDDSKLGEAEVREVIGKMEPNQFLDAMAKTTNNPEALKTFELIKENPEAATALRDAIAKDETMLSGMQEVLGADGAGADLTALNTVLVSDFQSGILTEVLTKIGDGSKDLEGNDIGFDHLKRLMDAQKIEDPAKRNAELQASLDNMGVNPAAQIDFMQFIKDFFENPERAINNLVNDLVDARKIDPDMANKIKGIGASIGVPIAEVLQPYKEYQEKYINGDTLPTITRTAESYGDEMTAKHGASQAQLDATSAEMNQPGATQAEAAQSGQTMEQLRDSLPTSFSASVEGYTHDPSITTVDQIMEQAQEASRQYNSSAPALAQ